MCVYFINNNSRYLTESLSGMSNIINYYNRYPLKTIKKEGYQKWVNVYLMMKLKKHLNKEGLIEIRELASLINCRQNLIFLLAPFLRWYLSCIVTSHIVTAATKVVDATTSR